MDRLEALQACEASVGRPLALGHEIASSATREWLDGAIGVLEWLRYVSLVASDNLAIADCVRVTLG